MSSPSGPCNSKRPEYQSWAAMKDRCLNTYSPKFKYYGGRGITVCEEWVDSFETFFADMGERPTKKHTLDRIDGNGNWRHARFSLP